jgi:four helix bundle protein
MGQNYRNVKAWQVADDLAVEVYKLTQSFPEEELYGLTSQLRQAVASVPANIAEGASRGHKKEYLQFLYVARGSLAEADYHLHFACRLNYVDQENYNFISKKADQLGTILFSLIQMVKREIM